MFVVGFLFALPNPVAGIPMPSKLLWKVLPAFRVPSRWDPLLMTALLPLAALGLQALWRVLAVRRLGAAVGVVGAAMVVSFVELATHPVHHFRTVPVPEEYRALASRSPRGILAEYPLGYSDIYRLWQRIHGRPLVNGAPEDSVAGEARLVLLDPAQPGTAQALSLLGVTAIAIHPGGRADVPVQPREPAAAEGYRLVGRYPDGSSVWQVTARAAPAFVTLPNGFAAPRLVGDAVGYPLVESSAVLELRSRRAGVVRLVFDVVPPDGAARKLVFSDVTGDHALTVQGPTHFALDVETVRGVAQLRLRSDPFPTSETDAIVLTQPRTEAASGKPVLLAGPSSSDPGF